MPSFGDNAVKLAKTPLGIIAIFVVLVEGIVAYIFTNSQNVDYSIQLIFTLFAVFFPIIVIGIFWHLVINHNTKLYSPSEYKASDDFLIANGIDPSKVARELEKDIEVALEKKIQALGAQNLAEPVRAQIHETTKEYQSTLDAAKDAALTVRDLRELRELKEKLDSSNGDEKVIQEFERDSPKLAKKMELVAAAMGAGAAAASPAVQRALELLVRLF